MCNSDIDPIDQAAWETARNYKDDSGQKGAQALARTMGTNAGTFGQKVSRNDQSHTLSIRDMRSMMRITKDYRLLHAMAMDVGHACFKIPSTPYQGDTDILNAWADWNEEVSETVHEIRKTVKADGIGQEGIKEIRRELIEDLGKGLSLLAVLESMAEPE